MANKKYYWLKLKDTFFEDETITFIEEQENGIKYSNFYLKLCLKSVRTNGKLIRLVGETLIPYDVKSLSRLTNVDFDTVLSAMGLFEKMGIISVLENGELYLTQVQEMIGSETEKAIIMRRSRAEKKTVGNNVTKMLPYIEKDKEKDLDIKKEKNNTVKDIVEYLNQKANKSFKDTSKKTKDLINARLKEGFTVDDFKKVIDLKCNAWLKDVKMNEYLRPETLFGTKFESYLNSNNQTTKDEQKNNEQEITKEDYERVEKVNEDGEKYYVYERVK